MSEEVGRIVLVVGLVIVGVGLLTVLGIRIPVGQLTGDIRLGDARNGIFIPIGTSILISVVLTILLALLGRR